MSYQKQSYKAIFPISNNVYQQNNQYVIPKQQIIQNNYTSIYHKLLPSEVNEVSFQLPILIGDKDVYALSDIEGYNIWRCH